MPEIQAPNKIPTDDKYKVFLGGSIDMNKAERWQEKIVQYLDDEDLLFLNPRRNDFDPSLEQSIHCKEFVEQVEWELSALEKSDMIIFYFDPNGKAPVTMLELGLYCKSNKKIIVCCRDGFWRKGNVDIVCNRYGITTIEAANIEEFCEKVDLTIRTQILKKEADSFFNNSNMKIRGENGV